MLAVTGANGHLGRRLIAAIADDERGAPAPVRALVRSAGAAAAVRRAAAAGALDADGTVDVMRVDAGDPGAMAQALQGCTAVVHLVGIIREGAGNRYVDAHEASCRALAEAAVQAGVRRIVYLSILGAAADSPNACLASKAAAERILQESPVPAVVIRVPMVLGEGDYASTALGARARRSVNVLLRGASLEQPIYAGDVVAAVRNALSPEMMADPGGVLDLAGPESLSRAALVHRAAHVLGRRTRVVSIPLACGLGAAFVLERFSANPPVTRAMLGVLDHDDRINPEPALRALALTLTSLDETLRRCLV